MTEAKISISSIFFSLKESIIEWINSDLTIIIYVIKLTMAALLAMSVSMYFNLSVIIA